MEAEDNRTGSADSENGSSDSYVHVPQEEVQGGDPMCETDPENANQDEEDIYTFSGEQEDIKPSMEVTTFFFLIVRMEINMKLSLIFRRETRLHQKQCKKKLAEYLQ